MERDKDFGKRLHFGEEYGHNNWKSGYDGEMERNT